MRRLARELLGVSDECEYKRPRRSNLSACRSSSSSKGQGEGGGADSDAATPKRRRSTRLPAWEEAFRERFARYPVEQALADGDHVLLRMNLLRGETSVLRMMMENHFNGRRLLDILLDRVVTAHDIDAYSRSGGGLDAARVGHYQETLRLLSAEFQFHRKYMLRRCMLSRYQIREASDLGVVECIRCVAPPPADEFSVVLAGMMQVAVRCNWLRTMALLVEEYGVAFSPQAPFGALYAGPTCLLKMLELTTKRPDHPPLDMVTIRGGGWSESVFGHMYRLLKQGTNFRGGRWFVAEGAPAEVVRGLVRYGVDPLLIMEEDNTPGYRRVCARVFLETVAVPGMVAEIERQQPDVAFERDRLVMSARYLWDLCHELYELERMRWAERAAAVMLGTHLRVGGGSLLAKMEPLQVAWLVRTMMGPPNEPSEELGEQLRSFRLLF